MIRVRLEHASELPSFHSHSSAVLHFLSSYASRVTLY